MASKKLAMVAYFVVATAACARTPMVPPAPAICPSDGLAPLPSPLGGWRRRVPISAAADKSKVDQAMLVIGTGVDATLLPTSQVHYAVRPEKPGGSVSHGGLFAFIVTSAGTYRIAQNAGAWVDVVRGGKLVASIAHEHGPACSGVMKMVDFPLKPGRYYLQVSANSADTLALIITKPF